MCSGKNCWGLVMLSEGDIVAIYKPTGMSSFAVVARLKRLTGIARIGHAGTLDPEASGVLVVGIGRSATKQLATFVAAEKEYLAQVRLGASSSTDDREGTITQTESAQPVTQTAIERVLTQFRGVINQVPPAYSAVKINGQRAYRLARKGKAVELGPRQREVKLLEVIDYSWPNLQLRVITGKGVYIRSLARDIGEALGVGGYLTGLERTRVGQFGKDKALHLDELEQR